MYCDGGDQDTQDLDDGVHVKLYMCRALGVLIGP